MCRCESWTKTKVEHQRIDAFELWCWRRLLRVPWTAKRSNQSILKQISPEYSLEGLMPKLKLQYFGHLMWRTDSLVKTLMGKIEDGGRGWQKMRLPDVITDSMTWIWVNSGCWWWTGKPGMLQSVGCKELDMTEWLNWTEWSSAFPYFPQFKSEFCSKEFMIWVTVSSQSCFCWLYRACPSSATVI